MKKKLISIVLSLTLSATMVMPVFAEDSLPEEVPAVQAEEGTEEAQSEETVAEETEADISEEGTSQEIEATVSEEENNSETSTDIPNAETSEEVPVSEEENNSETQTDVNSEETKIESSEKEPAEEKKTESSKEESGKENEGEVAEPMAQSEESEEEGIEAFSMLDAQDMYLGQTISSQNKDGESKTYRFKVMNPGKVDWKITFYHGGIKWYLMDSRGQTIQQSYSIYWNGDIEQGYSENSEYLEPGEYYLEVKRTSSEGKSNFQLSTTFKDSKSTEREPNNDTSTAQSISSNSTYTGMLSLTDEKDVYSVTLPSDGTLKFNLKACMYGVKIYVLDAQRNPIYDTYQYWDQTIGYSNADVEIKDLARGKYYIQLTKHYCDGGFYYLKVLSQLSQADGWYNSNGKTYYYQNGVPAKGWKVISGQKYYFSTSNGEMKKGWQKIGTQMYYFSTATGVMKTGWGNIGTCKYYFSTSTGQLKKGWQQIGSSMYYFSTRNGEMRKGFQQVGSKKYYFSSKNGQMKKGWQKLGSYTYYFSTANGQMKTGMQKIGTKYYYFDSNGRLR